MFGFLGFLFGIFALFWTGVFAAVGMSLLLVFLIPLILLAVLFRVGILLFKVVAAFVLLGLLAVCLF